MNGVGPPFSASTEYNLSTDKRTRVALFACKVDLVAGEGVSIVTAQAEDAQHNVHRLAVEYVGKVPGFDWLTQVNVRLPTELAGAGDVWVSITVRGVASNRARLAVQ